ncbi:MAG: hypothetical protein PHI50_00820 [Alphaproteobacteria bacterium]|nr:hypothetical protein [Alphaproteobacteria bacterium]
MPLFIFFFLLILSASFLWIGGVIVYIEKNGGLTLLTSMLPPDFSLFIASCFLPLVLLWIISLFLFHLFESKRKDKLLENNIMAIMRLGANSEAMSRSCLEMEVKVKNEALLQKLTFLQEELSRLMEKIHFLLFQEKEITTPYLDFLEKIALEDDFKEKFYQDLKEDPFLVFYVSLFCERASLFFDILNTYETEGALKKSFEESPLAKVYLFLSSFETDSLEQKTLTSPLLEEDEWENE